MGKFIGLAVGILAAAAGMAGSAAAKESPNVLCVQQQLNALGYDAGTADGLMGAKTRAAVSTYLESEGAVDGLPPDLNIATAFEWCVTLAHEHAEAAPFNAGRPDDRVIAGPGVEDMARARIWQGLNYAHYFVQHHLGIVLEHPVEVYASDNAAWMTQNYLRVRELPDSFAIGKLREFGGCDPAAEGSYYAMFLCMKAPVWTQGNAEIQTIRIVAHEYIHNVQFGLVGERGKDCCTDSDAMSIFGPQWLVEGSAEYLSYVLLRDFAGLQLERVIGEFSARVPDGTNLAELETRRGFRENQGWNAGVVAAHFLLEESGFPALVVFWKEIGEGTGMREAFETAFGTSTEAFYERFPSLL